MGNATRIYTLGNIGTGLTDTMGKPGEGRVIWDTILKVTTNSNNLCNENLKIMSENRYKMMCR